jgi:hypothetical protein
MPGVASSCMAALYVRDLDVGAQISATARAAISRAQTLTSDGHVTVTIRI